MMPSLSFRKRSRSFPMIKTPRYRNNILTRVENRTVMESAWSMLHAFFSSYSSLGGSSQLCAIHPQQDNEQTTWFHYIYEKWFAHKPSVSHYQVLGSLAFVHLNKEVRKSLDPEESPGGFCGI